MINYFISYSFWDRGNERGVANCDITMDKKIKNIKDVRDIEDKIKKEFKYRVVIIQSWVKF